MGWCLFGQSILAKITTYMIGFPKKGLVSFWAISSCNDNKILWRIKIRGHMCAKSTHAFININSPSVAPLAWSRRRNCRFGSSPISANRKGSQFHFIFRIFFSQIDQPHEKRIPVTPRSHFSVVWKKRRRRRPTDRPTVISSPCPSPSFCTGPGGQQVVMPSDQAQLPTPNSTLAWYVHALKQNNIGVSRNIHIKTHKWAQVIISISVRAFRSWHGVYP